MKGTALGSPVIDEADIRGHVGDFAEKNGLISNVENFFFKYIQEALCKPAIN